MGLPFPKGYVKNMLQDLPPSFALLLLGSNSCLLTGCWALTSNFVTKVKKLEATSPAGFLKQLLFHPKP